MTLYTLGLGSHQIVDANNVIYDKYLFLFTRAISLTPKEGALETQ